jgi:uncharacterized protein (DUF2062 family)
MSARRNIIRQLLRWAPRKRKLRGSFLHRIIGDRLFDPAIWKLSARRVAAGLAIGTFIAFTPTIPLQMTMAAILSYIFRVNVPAALLACWITNPVTAPVIYAFEYQLGVWINSALNLSEIASIQESVEETAQVIEMMDMAKKPSLFKGTMKTMKHLIIGSVVMAMIFSALIYGIFYPLLKRVELRRLHRRQTMPLT